MAMNETSIMKYNLKRKHNISENNIENENVKANK